MQFDKSFTSHFVDPDTRLPITGLTGVTITILQRNDDNTYTKVVDAQSCIELMDGWYQYVFSAIQDKFYLYAIYPNDDRVQPESGFVDKRLNNLDGAITDIRTGGGHINIQGIQTSIRNVRDNIVEKIEEEHKKTRELIISENNDMNSHIEIAKSETIDTIKAIEIPEIPETDLSKITESLGTLKMNLTKLSQFVRSEAENEKNEEKEKISEEYESKISEMVDKIEKIEEAYRELDLSIEEKEKLIETMEETAKEIMDELEKEKEEARKEGENSVKEKLISSLSE